MIVYIANMAHQQSAITNEDIAPFHELVTTLEKDCDVDFMLQSPGGDPNAAEMLINTLLSKARHIRMIIPQSAKSAATMISLAADEIVMSDTSELGPIDPQVPMITPFGYVYRPAFALLNTLDIIKEEHKNGEPLNSAYVPVLQGVDAALIDACHKAIQQSKDIAAKWLLRAQYVNNPTGAEHIANQLTDVNKYPSHAQVINHAEAAGLGLNVQYLSDQDDVWQAMWRLYIRYITEIREHGLVKVFESNYASVTI
ncbi:SDH family Clp fold serine proteinase [Alicyclobacillus acidoterrestris]|uniref:SDH family Clp fold serine proteinase n=1 Tax=Alicyclobacillus acidoterrestris TaxID=1450 RepID=UPI003F5369D5